MLTKLLRRWTGADRHKRILNLLNRPDRATDRCCDAIKSAVRFADELGSPAVDSHHLLMGVVGCDTLAAHVLTDCNLASDMLLSAIHDTFTAMHRPLVLPTDIPVAMKATENWALRASRRLFDEAAIQYIGTEHLLLGLATDGTRSSAVLNDFGIRLYTLSEKVDQMFTPRPNNDEP